jgi:outer membrane biosynthesis protein TonB
MAAVSLDSNSSKKGFVVSGVIHAVLFLLLLFIMLDNPPKEDAIDAVILDFGGSEEGTGGNSDSYGGGSTQVDNSVIEPQPVSTAPPTPAVSPPTPAPAPTPSTSTVSSYDADAVALQKQQKLEAEQKRQEALAQQKLEEQRKKEAAELLKKQQEEQAAKDAVANAFQKGKTNAAGGSGSGSGSGTGNNTGSGSGSGGLGNSGGSGSGSGSGGGGSGGNGSGIGINYSMQGRTMINSKQPYNNSSEGGKIVVLVKIDKNGQVISAQGPYKGSTSTNAYLVKISEDAAKQFKFSASEDGVEEQVGTLVFNYGFSGN